MVITRSKRAKRILRCLSAAQHEDHVLSYSTTPLIRYNLLHDYHRCVQVSVELGGPADRLSVPFSFDALPNFLQSQLEAQKIADGSRLLLRLAPLLTFVQAHLPRLDRSRAFPTLFIWHSRENHRSYLFFAFVEIRMVSKTYTARELLRLRKVSAGKEFYDRLVEKLRKEQGLGDIHRIPPRVSLPLIEEEDVDAPAKPDPGPTKNIAARQLDGTDAEWKYRGRIESEEDVAHPICGPAGPSAQKDEGFQRFYKSVVSPTHVRVTAGGRIVPNTRGSSSPTAKWSKDRSSGDSARNGGREQSEPIPIPQPHFGAFSTMIPGFAPAVAPGMSVAHAPFHMMPWHLGVNMGGAFSMLHPSVAALSGHMPGSVSSAASTKSDKHSESGNSENTGAVHVSPPEHFDHSRPFFYNGQWMMPSGHAMMPVGMPSMAGFPVPMMQPRYGMHPVMHLHTMRSDPSLSSRVAPSPAAAAFAGAAHPPVSSIRHNPSLSSRVAPSPAAAAFAGAAHPPVSSIRHSEITKRQLENLRSHLRFIEDQLLYNKHQIDERVMEQQTQVLRHQIHLFEKNLEAQLTIEGGQSTQPDSNEESTGSDSSNDVIRPKPSTAKCRNEAEDVSTSQDDTPPARVGRGIDRLAPQHSPSAAPVRSLPLKSALKKTRSAEINKKSSSLPVSAALAPPFQPRVDGTRGSASTGSPVCVSGPLAASDSSGGDTEARGDAGNSRLCTVFQRGCGPSAAGGADYMLGRDLTDDELLARDMYWCDAPRSLPIGQAKFGGRALHPASPVRGGSSASEAASSSPVRPPSDYSRATAKAESDLFKAVEQAGQRPYRSNATQSEELPRLESPVTPTPASAKQTPRKAAFAAGRSYDDFRKALAGSVRAAGEHSENKSSSDSGDDSNLLFKGRKSVAPNKSKTPNDIWQSVLRKGKSSGAAIPGTVSSMTAQGVLPNYAGHATASLTPAIANTPVSPQRVSSRKPAGSGDAGSAASVDEEKKVENRPPTGNCAKGSVRHAGV
ncbi:hypothetical protein L249_6121 [Ophiocordyceps polyrhachis-furcata BCC 54312]|uniref:Uncharacterized protein n=1 Tax=Ophiocordyceps polyrhachis-furcata BCC 54312 TaxID=1330021 RepID=A0A367LJ80_9HYPO|nr:hypothetical protein L249_6121 [Ophiocordyceps polyrhachis-furcata BCC 54312]